MASVDCDDIGMAWHGRHTWHALLVILVDVIIHDMFMVWWCVWYGLTVPAGAAVWVAWSHAMVHLDVV
jgi:hypothetical protein